MTQVDHVTLDTTPCDFRWYNQKKVVGLDINYKMWLDSLLGYSLSVNDLISSFLSLSLLHVLHTNQDRVCTMPWLYSVGSLRHCTCSFNNLAVICIYMYVAMLRCVGKVHLHVLSEVV